MFKKTAIYLALFMLLAPFCAAQEVSDIIVSSRVINNRVTHSQWAEFNVTVTNKLNESDTFLLSIPEEGIEFSSLAEPLSDLASGMKLGPGQSKTIRYMVKPNDDLTPNPKKPYKIQLSAESTLTGKIGSAILQVFVFEEEVEPIIIIYESDINVSFNIPYYLDPRNIYSFKIDLRNNNPKDIKSLILSLDSATIKKNTSIELGPEVKKTIDFTVKFDSVQPMKDSMTITVTEGNITLYKTVVPFEIVGYEISFKIDSSVSRDFLRRTETIRITNEEVIESQQRVKVEASSFYKMFTKTVPAAEDIVEEDGKRYFVWTVQLLPNESTTITIISSYRPILAVLLLIGLLILIMYILRNPLQIIKEADSIVSKDGGINEIKVVLTLKNRSNKTFENVKVLDKIPKIAGFEKKKNEVGTLQPTKIKQRPDGSILQWEIDKVEGKEERIISYSFLSKLGIVGDMRLPPAMVVNEVDGKRRKAKSNELDITTPD